MPRPQHHGHPPLHLPCLAAVRAAGAMLLVPFALTAAADKPIVFEAENAARLDGPFEFCRDNAASGGLAIRVREGMGTDFDDRQTRELRARYPAVGFSTTPGGAEYELLMPERGHYVTWARVYWLWECSNSVWVGPAESSAPILTDRLYRRWHWVRASRPLFLEGGRQTFRISNREDGIRVDQVCLTRDRGFRPAGILRTNALFASGPDRPPLHLSPVASVPLVFARAPTACALWIRNTDRQPRTVSVQATSDRAVSVELPENAAALTVPALTGLIDVPFSVEAVRSTPLREATVRLTVTPRQGAAVKAEIVLTHAPDWEVAGPFSLGSPQGTRTPHWSKTGPGRPAPLRQPEKLTWRPVADPRFFTGSGRLDLARVFSRNTRCWAYLRATFPWAGDRPLAVRLRSDDQSVVWLNGKRACSHPVVGPGERYFTRAQLPLKNGENTLLAAVAQVEAFWEISLTPCPP